MKKIVLIHGWDYHNYTKFNHVDAWHNRINFIKELSKNFIVYKNNLPGFCSEPEPETPWLVDDYAHSFQEYLEKQNIIPDLVLGYSFGAAVALRWKILFHNNVKLALVSPAICRNYKKKTLLEKLFIIKNIVPKTITVFLRNYYLKMIGNKFYTEGTTFLKNTYLNIVGVDMSVDLNQVNLDEMLFIFGENDSITPPKILIDKIKNRKLLNRIIIIPYGTHDIANTHYVEINNYLIKYLQNENISIDPKKSMAGLNLC